MQRVVAWLFFTGLFVSTSFASADLDAYHLAQTAMGSQSKDHLLSIYGKGSGDGIKVWFLTFYDETAKHGARVVVIEDGKIDRVHPADSDGHYDDALHFNPETFHVRVEKAIATAEAYAAKQEIKYTKTNVLLRRPEAGKAPRWEVTLMEHNTPRGIVYTNSLDGAFSQFQLPPKRKGFFQSVGDTFLGIGGDLEEFFTGERTVDR